MKKTLIYFSIFIFGAMAGWRLTRKQSVQTNIDSVAKLNNCYDQLKDYQLHLTRDSIYVYDGGKLLGVTVHYKNIPSIILANTP